MGSREEKGVRNDNEDANDRSNALGTACDGTIRFSPTTIPSPTDLLPPDADDDDEEEERGSTVAKKRSCERGVGSALARCNCTLPFLLLVVVSTDDDEAHSSAPLVPTAWTMRTSGTQRTDHAAERSAEGGVGSAPAGRSGGGAGGGTVETHHPACGIVGAVVVCVGMGAVVSSEDDRNGGATATQHNGERRVAKPSSGKGPDTDGGGGSSIPSSSSSSFGPGAHRAPAIIRCPPSVLSASYFLWWIAFGDAESMAERSGKKEVRLAVVGVVGS